MFAARSYYAVRQNELAQLCRQLMRTSRLTARKYLLIRLALWTLFYSLCLYLGSVFVEAS